MYITVRNQVVAGISLWGRWSLVVVVFAHTLFSDSSSIHLILFFSTHVSKYLKID